MGLEWNYEIFGLCGRVLPAQNPHMVDEVYRLHALDGWVEGVFLFMDLGVVEECSMA